MAGALLLLSQRPITPPEYPTLRTPPTVIVVEPDAERLSQLLRSLTHAASVIGCTDFQSARARLLPKRPELLVTNIRLREYNGIHLVMLTTPPTRSIVYMEREDPVLLREAQRVGAYVESPGRLVLSLRSYLGAALREPDRRDVMRVDRRGVARGGRRAADPQMSA